MSQLSPRWETAKLVDVCKKPDYGFTASANKAASGPKFLRITDIQGSRVDWSSVPRCIPPEDERLSLAPGDIVVARTGATTGKSFLVDRLPEQAVFASYLVRVRPEKNMLPKWVWLYFQSSSYWRQIEENKAGNAQPGVNASKLANLKLPVPPAYEQRRIVAKVDSLRSHSTRARDELASIPRLIDRYKQAVLTKAFRGDLTADWRREREAGASTRKLESRLGPLPSSWTVCELKDISEIQTGLALGKKRKGDAALRSIPYLRVANVQRGALVLDKMKETQATPDEISTLALKQGDILMNEGGDRDKLGRGWVWENQIDECIHQNHVFRIRLNQKKFPPKYISLFSNAFGQNFFIEQGKQTTNLASISKTRISKLPLPLAPEDEAVEIVSRIESAFAWIDRIAQEHTNAARLLDNLDQAILAKAFRGELVPQDPNDEPASVLLERIRAERACQPKPKRGRRKKEATA